jgi:hypothetical protein
MRKSDLAKNIKPYEGKHQRTNKIQGDNNDEQHDSNDTDDNKNIDNPKEVRACPTCGKRHRGRCWHNKKTISKAKSFILDLLVNRIKKRRILWKRSKN